MCAHPKEEGKKECGSNRELGVAERASGIGTGGTEPKLTNGWVRDGSDAVPKITGVSLDENGSGNVGQREGGGGGRTPG